MTTGIEQLKTEMEESYEHAASYAHALEIARYCRIALYLSLDDKKVFVTGGDANG